MPSEYGQLLTIASSGALQALEGADSVRRTDPEGAAVLAQAAAQVITAEAQALTAEAIATSQN